MIEFKTVADFPDPDALVPHALPWIASAGSPYFEILFGSEETAHNILAAWIRRRTSEVSIWRANFLLVDGQFAGGVLGLGGPELRKARKADSVAILMSVKPQDRDALMERLSNFSGLFAKVADDEFYGSKLGVNPEFRGKKLGSVLHDFWEVEGQRLGFRKFVLDVRADNEHAIKIYRAHGFEVTELTESKDKTVRYYTMRAERSAS
jgi:ribosomal protein S18 acetylase RimI-like enzyme